MKTENGLFAKIEIVTDKGFAGWIKVSTDRWIDCKWDKNGECLIYLGSLYNLKIDQTH